MNINSESKTAKSYAIFHDGLNVLVGSGGRVGKTQLERKGLHFPGGSYDEKEGDKDIADTAIRELKEEAGIIYDLNASPYKVLVSNEITEADYDVNFVLVKVNSIEELIGRVDESLKKRTNPYDMPFTELKARSFADALREFEENPKTDWFAKGLEAAMLYIDPSKK